MRLRAACRDQVRGVGGLDPASQLLAPPADQAPSSVVAASVAPAPVQRPSAHRPRRASAADDARLLQLSVVPIAAIIAAPYALVYELTLWLVSFWLLWCYTATRPTVRIGLLWLVAGVWLTGDMGVGLVLTGGSDYAALIGLIAVAWIAWLYHAHIRCSATLSAQLKTSSPRGSE